jgi:hypothetical protein
VGFAVAAPLCRRDLVARRGGGEASMLLKIAQRFNAGEIVSSR